MEEKTGQSQSCVSQHLQKLKAAGAVTAERTGSEVYYRATPEAARDVYKRQEADRGVIACSAGNHAQGIALSATKLGIKSIICMPAGAPISKVEATKNYGAEVVLVPGVYDDAAREAARLSKEHGYTCLLYTSRCV